MIMTYIVLTIALSVAFFVGSLYILARPKGLIERLMEHRGDNYASMVESFKQVQSEFLDLRGHVEVIAVSVDELRASTGRRLTAIETKTGKATRKEEKERERIEALDMIKHAAEQQNLTV